MTDKKEELVICRRTIGGSGDNEGGTRFYIYEEVAAVDDINGAELEISRKRVEHYMRENAALRKQIEIYQAANKNELQ